MKKENQYNFDQIIDRRNTDCLKYDFGIERIGRNDLLPLWIADMDFALPPEILEDISKVVDLGIFGYTETKEDYFDIVHDWFLTNHHWETHSTWLVKTPGIVFAIALAIKAFSKVGDAIIIQQPVYYPFSQCILDNKRKLINSQLRYENGKYEIDFDDFEQKIIDEHVTLFLLCNPQNPTGKVFRKDELKRLGDICNAHNVIVLSDEIHCDFTYPGYYHTVYASLGKAYEQNSIICSAPSKSFNLAGLQISNIFIANEELRNTFKQEFNASGYSQLNTVGLAACKSVYRKGANWHKELKVYINNNLTFVRNYLEERLPEIKLVEPEGTYLIWLDFSGLKRSYEELRKLIVDDAKLWLDGGIMFGEETSQFQRVNIACPQSILQIALQRIEYAIRKEELL